MASIQSKLEALINPAPHLADVDEDDDGDVDGTWARVREEEAGSDGEGAIVGESSLRKAAAISLADLDE
uniref:Uncharacterized protein n=1 Tax=Plectus sambesii TaxID=2011161 RepID=A0A914VWF4_9BILA